MTKEQAKEFLPIITAFAEGKTIEAKGNDNTWNEVRYPSFGNGPENYRIKPVSEYCPFKNAEECWKEMEKHQPFGWIKFKNPKENGRLHFETIKDDGVFFDSIVFTFKEVLEYYVFVDDSPFGVKKG